jgi:alkylation response protein AidB-like acyl-CoA dehydrogenase
MDFQLTPDQAAVVDAIDRLAAGFAAVPIASHGFALVNAELERELRDGGYFDLALIPELGLVTAALAVERLARLPCTSETALSMLLRPQLPGEWPRPLALVENGRPGRFVASARTIVLIEGERIGLLQPAPDDVEPVDSLFAYPMGRLKRRGEVLELGDGDAAKVRTWLRIALAAEASGLMQGALASCIEHVSVRKQFGRPLGSFQALRHRLAECAMLGGGLHWLMLKAASTGDESDAALAALHAQESASRLVYDMHQMLGAMGMTLEHPLHLWTYRLKALLSELGGRGGQAAAVARHCFAED